MANHYSFSKSIISFLAILVFLAGCTGPQVVKEEEKAGLTKRVNEYWQYRIKGDAEKAYQYEVPSYREKYGILAYLNRFRLVKYFEAEIQELKIEGKEATATMKLTYTFLLKRLTGKKLDKLEQEKWLNIKNVWYHVPEDFEMERK